MGLPAGLFGIIYDTASTSSMHAIAAARELADPEARTLGASRGFTLYCSEQAHSSIEKGAIAIGIGQRNVRKIPVDAEFRMRPDALAAAMEADIAAGLRPFCVVATVGTTSTTSIDPGAGHRRYRRSATVCGCTWMPLTPARPPSYPSCATFWMAPSAPIRW